MSEKHVPKNVEKVRNLVMEYPDGRLELRELRELRECKAIVEWCSNDFTRPFPGQLSSAVELAARCVTLRDFEDAVEQRKASLLKKDECAADRRRKIWEANLEAAGLLRRSPSKEGAIKACRHLEGALSDLFDRLWLKAIREMAPGDVDKAIVGRYQQQGDLVAHRVAEVLRELRADVVGTD